MYIENTPDGRDLVVDMTDADDIDYVINELVQRIISQGYLRKEEVVDFREWEYEDPRNLYPVKLYITPETVVVADYLPLLMSALQEELASNRALFTDDLTTTGAKIAKQLRLLEAITYLQFNFD